MGFRLGRQPRLEGISDVACCRLSILQCTSGGWRLLTWSSAHALALCRTAAAHPPAENVIWAECRNSGTTLRGERHISPQSLREVSDRPMGSQKDRLRDGKPNGGHAVNPRAIGKALAEMHSSAWASNARDAALATRSAVARDKRQRLVLVIDGGTPHEKNSGRVEKRCFAGDRFLVLLVCSVANAHNEQRPIRSKFMSGQILREPTLAGRSVADAGFSGIRTPTLSACLSAVATWIARSSQRRALRSPRTDGCSAT